MTFSIKKLPDSKIELTVDLAKSDLVNYVTEVEHQLVKEVKIEGFREGKAPKEIIRQRIGEDKIRQEALELAIKSSLATILKNEKISVVDQSELKLKENSPEKLIYQVILTVFPEFKIARYTNLNINKNRVSVEAKEIEEVLAELVKTQTKGEEVERAAQMGDRVEIDFMITLSGRLITGGKSDNHPLILGQNKFVPGFEGQVVGLKKGQTKKFILEIPVAYYNKEIAGKTIEVEATVKRVEKLNIPVLNDDFAKKLGRFASLKDVRDNISQGLLLEKEAKEKDRVRLAILKAIGEKTEFEIPKILIEKQIDTLINEFDNELHQKGMEIGPYLAHIKKTQADLRKDWREQAELQVKLTLIVQAVAREENISVTQEEIEQEFVLLAENYAKNGQLNDLQQTDLSGIKGRINSLLLNEKVLGFLEKNNIGK